MKKQQPKNTHGGPNRGQGKKPGIMGKKVTKSMALSPDIAEWWASLGPTDEDPKRPSASTVIEGILRKSKEFKMWVDTTITGEAK